MTSHLLTTRFKSAILWLRNDQNKMIVFLSLGIIWINVNGCNSDFKFNPQTGARMISLVETDTTHPTPKPIIYHHYELSGSDTQFLSLKQIINLSDDLSNKQKNYFLNWINTSLKIDSTKK